MSDLQRARESLAKRRREPGGCDCPCCDQHVQEYGRTIHASMARDLIAISRLGSTAWVDVRELDLRSGDYAKLRYWQLIEPHPESTGFWRLTQLGLRFVSGTERVSKYARVYNGQVIGFSGDKVDIRWCLGEKFDYQRLMSGVL